ncbi:MAG: hypothetical protein OEV95_03430 [Gemmatimonadota bacterium]|nr:hypothetical protein [Gemmatimonadota bacterium]
MNTYLKTGVRLLITRVDGVEATLPFLLNPASPGAAGMVFQPDLSPGAPPNAYNFDIPVDGDGDGVSEAAISGDGVFNGDPANAGLGFGGHLDVTLTTTGGLGNFSASLDFTSTAAGRELSGTGSFTDAATGNTTTLTLAPAAPLLVRHAAGSAGSVPNACAYSLEGDMDLVVSGPLGTLAETWGFLSSRKTVRVTKSKYTAPDAKSTDMPDASVDIPCGSVRLQDWNGAFLQHWACLPPEFGQATLTLDVGGGSTINISDEDPPLSGDINTYQATVVSGNANYVRGFFIAGPTGSTYREDFIWTLAPSKNQFSQFSYYTYLEGPSVGSGGLCGGTATRQP